ncbi:unnamed protein product [Diplocarpon coronariae]
MVGRDPGPHVDRDLDLDVDLDLGLRVRMCGCTCRLPAQGRWATAKRQISSAVQSSPVQEEGRREGGGTACPCDGRAGGAGPVWGPEPHPGRRGSREAAERDADKRCHDVTPAPPRLDRALPPGTNPPVASSEQLSPAWGKSPGRPGQSGEYLRVLRVLRVLRMLCWPGPPCPCCPPRTEPPLPRPNRPGPKAAAANRLSSAPPPCHPPTADANHFADASARARRPTGRGMRCEAMPCYATP